MSALLLKDGRVQRPFLWIFSLSTDFDGSGDAPLLKVVEWSSQEDYATDVAASNMDNGSFSSVAVPGFDVSQYGNPTSIFSTLIALSGDYQGATIIS